MNGRAYEWDIPYYHSDMTTDPVGIIIDRIVCLAWLWQAV